MTVHRVRHSPLLLALVLFSGCGDAGSAASDVAQPGASSSSTPAGGLPDDPTTLDAEPCAKLSLEHGEAGLDPKIIAAQGKLDGAARAINSYANRHPESFTGLRVCHSPVTIFVYRVAGDRAFDEQARIAAQQHKVPLVLKAAPYSRRELRKVPQLIMRDYMDDLKQVGADWLGSGVSRLGWVEVGVKGNFDAARSVLAGFGDRVHVVQGSEVTFD